MTFYCNICDYVTSRKHDFNKHIKTKKHIEKFGHICYNQSNDMINKCDDENYAEIVSKASRATFLKECDFSNQTLSGVTEKNKKNTSHAYGFATFLNKSRITEPHDNENKKNNQCYDNSSKSYKNIKKQEKNNENAHKKYKIKKKQEKEKKKIFQEKFVCHICSKSYKTRSGLRKHKINKHNCDHDNTYDMYNKNINNEMNIIDKPENKNDNEQLTKLIEILLNENKNLQHKMIDLASKPTVINQTNHTKTFNIINYLNHDCKDAMNLSDFIHSLVITFEDLENIETHGFLKSVKHSLIDSLNAMEQNKRPIHCTDMKRKQFYIKNEDVWNKDTNHIMIHKAITDFNHNQLIKFSEWKKENPNWLNDDKQQDKVNKITKELTCIYSDDNDKMKHKLINDIVDVTIIQKDDDTSL